MRVALEPLEADLGELAGRVCVVSVAGVTLVGVYGAASDPVRYSSKAQRQRKREWLAAYDRWLADWLPGAGPTLMVGDLNIVDPQHDSRLPYVLPEEAALYDALVRRHGLTDAYRLHHPDGDAITWVDHSGAGCRYDHAFVTAEPAGAVRGCDLLHAPREAGFTDHSALRVQLDGSLAG
ncbi:hypothetical protein PZ938_14830 [Luteipulveratus sp. YIM 133132]|uniref:endonuclease/exonuclease/phosphatase family protein n=1 Tax=Luteipulveratus flavus TaxID=3031728 RepID=UPI0023B03BA6|nr:endonuclease/exonuclease/phosphatase family protein [Luteipulveratus sp. YIM 133132]MDE9366888.1 hypothetical protein [Luteipulveratus sp. YIM 133132]